MLREALLALLAVGGDALLRPAAPRARATPLRALAPEDELLDAFAAVAADGRATLDAAAGTPVLAELLSSGDLGPDELRTIWGDGERDAEGFLAVCAAIDELFDDGDDPSREYLLVDAAAAAPSAAERLEKGQAVVALFDVASPAECEALYADGLGAFRAGVALHQRPPTHGRGRFAVADAGAFPDYAVVGRAEAVLLRVLDAVDELLPDVYERLFAPGAAWAARQPNRENKPPGATPDPELGTACPSLRDLYMAGELEWSEGEPAINVYEPPGLFGAHKDHMALTVLMPLTPPDAFSGGGTGFWPPAASSASADGATPPGEPIVLAPDAGTALIFGGDVSHAAMPITYGRRSVMVASFSTRTPASPADRVNGLQPAPDGASGSLRRNW